MKEKIILLFVLVFGLMSVSESYSLQTYVGIKILNLTDDPTASCAGLSTGDVDNPLTPDFNETTYDYRGRIRALSSILPDFPIYFELSYADNDSLIWSGNSTEDIDYEIGNTILMPQLIDIQTGVDYHLFLDIDAIRIYLPLQEYEFSTYGKWNPTFDDNYWTVGRLGIGALSEHKQYFVESNPDWGCIPSAIYSLAAANGIFISNNRYTLSNTCSSPIFSCHLNGLIGIRTYADSRGLRIYKKYDNLHTPTVGNINLLFTGP